MEQQDESRRGAATPAQPHSRPRRGWLGTLIALVLVAALGALAWHLTHKAPAGAGGAAASGGAGGGAPGAGGRRGAPATTVGVATVTQMDIPVTLDALGTVTPSATVTVSPQVSGVITQIAYQEGQMVRKGQLLAVIDPRPYELALMQAEGQQKRDAASLDAARVTLQRYQTLLQQDSIARQDVDTQAATVKQLEGTVLTDQAASGTARLNVTWSRITAPASGRVGLRPVDVGNFVSAGNSTGVAVITELAPIDVEFALPQDRIPDLQARAAKDSRLTVTAYDRTRQHVLDTGVYLSLNNLTDTQTGTVRAKARFANASNALFPSQFVNVRLLLDTVRGALVVPVTALRHGPDGDFVYLLASDRTVSLRTVTSALATADSVQITKGLEAGDRVITEGADRLKDGAKVVLPGDAPSSAARGGGASGARAGHRRADGASAGASGAHPGHAASGAHRASAETS